MSIAALPFFSILFAENNNLHCQLRDLEVRYSVGLCFNSQAVHTENNPFQLLSMALECVLD